MLHAGLNRPISCPFSSLAYLGGKKEGSWQLCVDYRKLNRVTIADKYLIPVIQEMSDELQGATLLQSRTLL